MEMNYKLPTTETAPAIFEALLAQKHLLIAGTPGAGKSVLLNGLVYNILHRPPHDMPGGAKLILIDQKGVELIDYASAPHTICHAVEPEDVVSALEYAIKIMAYRYQVMVSDHVKLFNGADIYIIVDEWADLMVTNGKKVVPLIQRLAQMGRAAKIHVVLSTQCILAKIVPTEIKCCFDSVVALRTATRKESNYIIGIPDCVSLPMFGSCYIKAPCFKDPVLYDGIPFVSEDEIADIVSYWTRNTGSQQCFPVSGSQTVAEV